MDTGDPISIQAKDNEGKGKEKIKKSKLKKGADSDSDGEHSHHPASNTPPNLFCTLPSAKSPLPTQPIPLAFLHRIVAENRIKNGLSLEDYQYLHDRIQIESGGKDDAAASRSDGSAANGELRGTRNGHSDSRERLASTETILSNNGSASNGNLASGDSTLLPASMDQIASSSSSPSLDHSISSNNALSQHHTIQINQGEPSRALPQPSEVELEAPWFSQLASLPHLRSAGIPAISPQSTSNPSYKGKEKMMNGFGGGGGGLNLNPDGRPNTSSGSGITRNNSPTNNHNRNHHPTSMSVQSSPGGGNDFRPRSANGISAISNQFQSFGLASESSLNFPSHQAFLSQPNKVPIPKPIPISQALNLSAEESLDEPLLPPDNFSMVNTWVYRSSFPKKKHFPFLKSLGLRSVLTLILEEYPEQNTKFLDEQGIKFFQYGIPGNKEPFVQIPEDKITAALVTILDRRNHPMLIHCNKGKHRTGCLIGCLRKLQQWSLTTIFDEYRRFSFPKSRSMDQEFIELYRENEVWKSIAAGDERVWLPKWSVISSQLASLPPQISSGSQNRQLLLSSKHREEEEDRRYQTVRGM